MAAITSVTVPITITNLDEITAHLDVVEKHLGRVVAAFTAFKDAMEAFAEVAHSMPQMEMGLGELETAR